MLVNYSSSSEEESEDVAGRSRKRQKTNGSDISPHYKKRECSRGKDNMENRVISDCAGEIVTGQASRLPLPSTLLDMFQDTEEQHVDDCVQHGGRQRSFQHERGNWATYVYLPYEPEDVFLELLEELRVCAEAHGVSFTLAEEFHVSVSKTVVLRHHWIQPAVQSLRSGLAQCRSFVCLADKLKVYCNDEKTRTFLGMEISTGCTQLLEIVKRVDQTMQEFNLSTFYKDPSFHVSLAWCVGDFTEKLQGACLSKLQNLVDGHEDGPFQLRLNFFRSLLFCSSQDLFLTFRSLYSHHFCLPESKTCLTTPYNSKEKLRLHHNKPCENILFTYQVRPVLCSRLMHISVQFHFGAIVAKRVFVQSCSNYQSNIQS
ncbi:U6 snRNA phosphodiesterase isoform X1 [Astyanax mexicanus]|uniref:U6 snRNA phosphodiesterase n=1 Tax=Astyanax mexicanus TaxID=7994 RepID=A0A8T2LT67_ASTMX|nr:U6 snRNA phosphodiesterase isoform X1 [Astyanax mexicanus]